MDDDLLMSSTEDKPALNSEFSLQSRHLYSELHYEITSVGLQVSCSQPQYLHSQSTALLPAAQHNGKPIKARFQTNSNN